MALPLNTLRPIRPSRNFVVVSQNAMINSQFFMKASTSGVAGMFMKYDTGENFLDVVTTAQISRWNGAGFLLNDVRDLSALAGRRNWTYDSVENFGGPVSVVQGPAVAMTRTYTGSPTLGQFLENGTTGYLAATSLTGSGLANALTSGMILAVVEAASDSQLNPDARIEGTQTGQLTPSNRNFIRIRIL